MDNFRIDKDKTHRILVIKPRAIGDVLLSTPVLPNLRREFPGATIDFLVESFASPVVEGNPHIDNVITYNTHEESSLSIIMKVRKNKYDLVIDLFANPRTAVITRLSGAKIRIGFPFKWRRYAYNVLVPPRSGTVHNVEFNLDALRRIGIEIATSNPEFYLDEPSVEFARDFMKVRNLTAGAFITVNIGGGWNSKRWPMDRFTTLCRMIDSKLRQPVVILYGPSEGRDARKISDASPAILAPPTTLKQMGAVLRASRFLVTNDSGPMHIAAALGVPTVALFGPTNPRLQGPYGNISEVVRNETLDCLECNLTKCPIGNPCMNDLTPDIVFEHITNLISRIENALTSATFNRGTAG